MAEYIDREEVFGRYEEEQRKNGPWSFRELISSIPAADVAPVKRGKWINTYIRDIHHLKCSECGEYTESIWHANFDYKYCPNCGAMMTDEE